MQSTILFNMLIISILVLAMGQSSDTHAGGFQTGIERNDCGSLKREIKRNWLQLQPFYEPKAEEFIRPKTKDLYCVDPGYTNRGFAKASVSSDYKCYTLQGQNFCCDKQLKACVGK
jgi:hypothetical protein